MFKRSQVAITDLFIALFIATILIIVVIFVWNRYSTILEEDMKYREMQILAFQTADLLVKSKGEPENWEYLGNVQTIGLASSDRNISTAKINAFLNLSNNITSKSLGIELYDFYFKLRHINGSKLAEYGEIPSMDKSMVNAQRLVLYQNERAIIEFALWR